MNLQYSTQCTFSAHTYRKNSFIHLQKRKKIIERTEKKVAKKLTPLKLDYDDNGNMSCKSERVTDLNRNDEHGKFFCLHILFFSMKCNVHYSYI